MKIIKDKKNIIEKFKMIIHCYTIECQKNKNVSAYQFNSSFKVDKFNIEITSRPGFFNLDPIILDIHFSYKDKLKKKRRIFYALLCERHQKNLIMLLKRNNIFKEFSLNIDKLMIEAI